MFQPELINSQTFKDWPLQYDPQRKQSIKVGDEKVELDTGYSILENGDVTFAVYAPNAGSVSISSGKKNLTLEKDSQGIFRGLLPFDPDFLGPHSLDVTIDGAVFLDPYMPISWHKNRAVNYIDLPDPETPYIHMRRVPHGTVSRVIYWSDSMNRYERCLVYTPAGYMKDAEQYPVLYLQHGATENETVWEYNGRMSYIMDNLIADGKCVPMIVVMNNGMIRYGSTPQMDDAFQDNLMHDCIPYIEANYRVKTDKWNRAIAGLSAGSMQASKIGLQHPELFGWIGIFSGFMRYGNKPPREDGYLSAIYNIEKFSKDYKLFFRCVGQSDFMYERSFAEDDVDCEKSGINKLPIYHRVIYPGQYHEFGAWRRALYDFAQLLFKE